MAGVVEASAGGERDAAASRLRAIAPKARIVACGQKRSNDMVWSQKVIDLAGKSLPGESSAKLRERPHRGPEPYTVAVVEIRAE